MNNAELYHRSNTISSRDALQSLEEYSKIIEWNSYGATIIDIGCGDGGVTTNVLKPFIPNNCKELIGCDISEKMIEFANAHHAKDFINFMVLDIESDLPDQLREKINHAFSFYALQWIVNQEFAFSNIYNLLAKGGDCLLTIVGNFPIYDVYRKLANSPRWNHWLRDADRYVSPYHDCQDSEKEIQKMMTTIGFTKVEVKREQKVYVFNGIEPFQDLMKALIPFKIPLEMQEDFFADYFKVFRDMELVHYIKSSVDGQLKVKIDYDCIVVYGKK